MKLVLLESPYAGDTERNVDYGRRCLRDSIMRGEAPMASHLLYTQPGVLNDDEPSERVTGINRGHAWLTAVNAVVVYQDLGISPGMEIGIKRAVQMGIPVEYRWIGCDVDNYPEIDQLSDCHFVKIEDADPALVKAMSSVMRSDCSSHLTVGQPTITFRDFIAVNVLAAVISNPADPPQENDTYAELAYEMADSMIKARRTHVSAGHKYVKGTSE